MTNSGKIAMVKTKESAKKSNNYNLTNKVCTERKERDKIEKNKWNNNAMF